MELKILGADCGACEHMRDLVLTAIDILVLRNVQIEVVTDLEEIGRWLKGNLLLVSSLMEGLFSLALRLPWRMRSSYLNKR